MGTSISSATEDVRLLVPRTSSRRNPSSVIVRPLNPDETLLCPVLSNPFTDPPNSVTFLLSPPTPPTPSAPYPFRRGLVPRTSESSDKLDGNCPGNTSGEGNGVSAYEGITRVDPLGVRMGEEVYEEPLMEEMERVEGIRCGVDKVKFSVCILSAL
jgi:hypothetical protein